MIEPMDFKHCDIIMIKGKHDNTKLKTPFVLRNATSLTTNQEQSQSCANIVTHSHAKIVLKGPTPSSPKIDQHRKTYY